MWRTVLQWTLLFIAAAVCALYLIDYGVLRYKMLGAGPAAGTDTVTVLYGTPLKDGQVEIYADQPQTEICARSIFPHLGYPACWYAKRHETRLIK